MLAEMQSAMSVGSAVPGAAPLGEGPVPVGGRPLPPGPPPLAPPACFSQFPQQLTPPRSPSPGGATEDVIAQVAKAHREIFVYAHDKLGPPPSCDGAQPRWDAAPPAWTPAPLEPRLCPPPTAAYPDPTARGCAWPRGPKDVLPVSPTGAPMPPPPLITAANCANGRAEPPLPQACPMNSHPAGRSGRSVQEIWEDFSLSFTPAVREVVEFAKHIPGFQALSQHDQVTLLKAGTFEVRPGLPRHRTVLRIPARRPVTLGRCTASHNPSRCSTSRRCTAQCPQCCTALSAAALHGDAAARRDAAQRCTVPRIRAWCHVASHGAPCPGSAAGHCVVLHKAQHPSSAPQPSPAPHLPVQPPPSLRSPPHPSTVPRRAARRRCHVPQVLMVRFASLFNVKEQTVTFMSRTKYSLEELWGMGMGDLLSSMFEFSEKLSALQLSDEELGLFTAVVLVSAGGCRDGAGQGACWGGVPGPFSPPR